MKFTNIAQFLCETPWAIRPSMLATMKAILRERMTVGAIAPEEIQARLADAEARTAATGRQVATDVPKTIAVLPIYGVLAPKMSYFDEISGGASTERKMQQFQELVDDPGVTDVILDFHTPGGSVYQGQEFADLIYQARGKKNVVGVANTMAASLGFYLLSQCAEVVVSPSGEVGSIGTILEHEDWSKWLADEGIAVTIITAGEHKGVGHPARGLSEEDRAYFQACVDRYNGMFKAAVARGRGVDVETVDAQFGQGYMFGAKEAVKLGMADRVETIDQVIRRLAGKQGATVVSVGARSADDAPEVGATAVDDPLGTEDAIARRQTMERQLALREQHA